MKRFSLAAFLALFLVGAVSAADLYVYGPVTTQKIDFGCVSSCATQTSSAFNRDTKHIRVVVTNATGYINFAASGGTLLVTAATGIFMPRDVPQVFRVPGNGKMGILAHSASGSVWITELE